MCAGFGATGGHTGTTVKYEPVTGNDTMTRNGVSTNIRTRIEVISAMKVSTVQDFVTLRLHAIRVEIIVCVVFVALSISSHTLQTLLTSSSSNLVELGMTVIYLNV